MAYENCNKASISITRANQMKKGLNETEEHEVLFDSNMRQYNQLKKILKQYKVCASKFAVHSDRSDQTVDIKSIGTFLTDRTAASSKLLVYALVQLIWCSYFIQKTTIFNHRIFQVLFSKFPNPRRHKNGHKCLIFLNKLAKALKIETEQRHRQDQHERINQNDQQQPLKLTSPLSCVLLILLLLSH